MFFRIATSAMQTVRQLILIGSCNGLFIQVCCGPLEEIRYRAKYDCYHIKPIKVAWKNVITTTLSRLVELRCAYLHKFSRDYLLILRLQSSYKWFESKRRVYEVESVNGTEKSRFTTMNSEEAYSVQKPFHQISFPFATLSRLMLRCVHITKPKKM